MNARDIFEVKFPTLARSGGVQFPTQTKPAARERIYLPKTGRLVSGIVIPLSTYAEAYMQLGRYPSGTMRRFCEEHGLDRGKFIVALERWRERQRNRKPCERRFAQ